MKANYFFRWKELSALCKTGYGIKILLFLCFGALSFNANAEDPNFAASNLIRDLVWNEAKGRVEFKVIFFDNWDDGSRDEYLKFASLYINNVKLGTLTVGKTGGGDVISSTEDNVICKPTNSEWEYANLYFYSHSASNTGHLKAYARGSTNACGQYITNTTNYTEIPINHGTNRWYTYSVGVVESSAHKANRCYAEFYWYPGEMTGDQTIEVALKDIVTLDIFSNNHSRDQWENTSGSVTATRPAASNHSMTGGSMSADGLTFNCTASEATSLQLLKNASGATFSDVETKSGSNVTFTGKYITAADEFLNGKTFSFNSRKAVSDGWTTYIRRSDINVTSQRTGVFTGGFNASLGTCGEVQLSWTIQNPSTTSNINTQGFVLEVKKGNGNWTTINNDVPYTAKNGGTTNYSYTYNIPDGDRSNPGTFTYHFRVKRAFVGWDDNTFGDNYETGNLFQRNRSITVNTNSKQLTNIAITPGGTENSNYPRLTWSMTTDGIECNDNITLKLKVGATEVEIPKAAILGGSYQTTAINGINQCTPQRYDLILQYGSLPAITHPVSSAYVYQPLEQREFETIEVSKGYYADRNAIKWTFRSGYDNFSRFRLMRKEASQSDDRYVVVGGEITHTPGVLQYNSDDSEINAGVYYIYKVEGIYECSSNTGILSSPTSIGFSQPYGSVSGRVTYTGSQAVKDVEINVATDNALTANRELEFNANRTDSYLSIPADTTKLFNRDGFGFEAWLKFTSSQADTIVSNSLLTVARGADSRITLTLNDASATVSAPLVNGEYTHLTVTAEKQEDYKHYTVKVYINDTVQYTDTLTLSDDAVTPKDPTIIGRSFTGYIDDVRVWNKTLTDAEVAINYDRVLGGKENGLAAYYKFDEIDAAESALFDCSAVGTVFNGNHAVKGSGVNRSNIPVSATHLSIKGVTDANGNYSIINSIPFTSEGTTYTLSPALGIHRFDPDNRPLYFSPDSRVFNNVDFTDISSFPVSGQIVYAGSNYPVEGVQIAIDGIVANRDGEIVQTGSDGKFTVDVPIGSHFITVSKQGHVFADAGRFPAEAQKKYNFQTAVNGLEFTDRTTVRIMGRVAGGNPQTEKPLGFGLSKANIGKATITLKANSDVYRLNLTGKDTVFANNIIGGVASRTTYKNPASGSIIEIETNPVTGEFLALVPPVPFSITGIKTKDFEDTFVDGDKRDFECSKMVFDVNPANEQTVKHVDTANVTREFAYHDSLKITYYSEPEFSVTDKNNKRGAFGDSVYIYQNPATGRKDTVRLYTVNGGTVTYALDYPVLSQKTLRYNWNVRAYEEYVNNDGAEPVIDVVPLKGSEISISNAMAAKRLDVDSINKIETRSDFESLMTLDTAGSCNYSFAVSFPNLAGDHTLNAKLTLNSNGREYPWELKAILFGQMPSDGSNFVTKGPDHVDIVLHDPPGSNSYAYIEKGSSYTSTISTSLVQTVTEAFENTLHLGPKIETATGMGLILFNESKSVIDIDLNVEAEEVWTDGNDKETTLNFSQQITTSGDPNYIGSMADVYIGRSTNQVFGMMNQLALYPKADVPEEVTPADSIGSFKLFPKQVLTAELQFGTMFIYTQQHLLESQIPNIIELRNGLIEHINSLADTANIVFGDKKIKYVSTLSQSNPKFGDTATYYVFYRSDARTERESGKDEVREYNAWIKNWQERIRENEETQIKLFEKRAKYESNPAANASDIWNNKRIFENISYDAGVSFEKSLEVSYSDLTTDASSWTIGGSAGGKTGWVWNNIGWETSLTAGYKRETGKETITGSGNSMKFGYVLAEDESVLFAGQDALSIDVYGPMWEEMKAGFNLDKIYSLSGFTFQRRAGQTSCPHEAADSTLFYTGADGKPVIKNYGTFKVENPQLYIDGKNSSSVENISAGREGTFMLQLQNLSESKIDVTYRLSVDATTNPDGLILELDGTPLTDVRQIRIKYGEEITKLLKVRQSSIDVLEYNDIAIRLGSVCDAEDYVEAYISAKFIPSSSPVKLVSDSRLANREGLNNLSNSGKIRFTVSDYDRAYKNFGCIRLEYRSVTNENWTTLHTFVNNASLYPVDSDDKELITGASHYYDFIYNATVPSDGEYIFRAVSVSKIGNDEITSLSDEIRVVKDVKSPAALGYPSPVNGILNAGDEISVTFNEAIQSGKLVDGVVGSNFSITGILNGDVREEPTSGVAFSGAQSAYTEQPVFTNGSFSIETWFKRTNNTAGTLFAYGSGNEYISLGFDATGHAIATIGDESYTSTTAIDNSDDTWKYVGLAYNRETGALSVNAYQGTQNLELFKRKIFTQTPATQGKLYLGNNAAGNSGFSGAAALLHFYNFERTEAQMSSTKSLNKSGTENGLIGLWELEENEGALAKDKARSRHLTLNNTSRYIYPLGKSRYYNGASQYTQLPSGTYPFGIYSDFAIEFWFNGGTQSAVTLLSIGTDTYVGFDSEGRLTLSHRAETGSELAAQILAPAGLLDGKWRHFALSVKRNGSARASIDGVVTATFNSGFFGDVGGGYYHLGVKYARNGSDDGYEYSEYFKGNIDELRVWNSALTAEAIVYNKNHSLRGDEPGLKAYYPFEKTTQVNGSIYSVEPSVVDAVNSSLNAAGSAPSNDESAPLQLARPVKNVPYTFTASDSKIVLNLTDEEYRLEGVTLYISVENVLDMHDNTSSTVNWIAYVNRNALNWNTDLVEILMEDGDSRTFKAAISNGSGEKKDYFIEDLPSWLSVDDVQGTLNPLATKELTFTIASGINIGAYEASVALTGTNNVKKILPVSLKVTGDRPNWSVNPADFESSMTVVGQLQIKGLPQEDPDDLLAAFVGSTCIGLVSPAYEKSYQNYLVYMQVWGNEADNGKDIVFKVWDASTGNIYPVVEVSENGSPAQIRFAANSLKGSPAAPIKFNALDAVEQLMLLNSGWNWVSFNVASPSLADVNELLTGIDNGIEIKGQNVFSRYESDNNLWTNGSLHGEGVSNTQMYMLKMSGDNTVSLPGSPINVADAPIVIDSGWNWIAYIPQVNETVDEAFVGANPANGDIVKSQTAFSVYDVNIGWVGTLDYLRPGLGYMYHTNSRRSFNYPKTGAMTRSSFGDPTDGDPLTLNRPYTSLNGDLAPNYETNLSLVGEVKLSSDGLSESARLIAVVGGDRRGIAEPVKVGDRSLFFLPVYSNSANETVTFILENNGKEIALRENIQYRANAVVGTPSSPVLLTDANIHLKAYPNPFTDRITVSFEIAEQHANANVKVELVSLTGATIYSTTYAVAASGPQLLDLDGAAIGKLTEGMYIIRVTLNNGDTFTNTVIKNVY